MELNKFQVEVDKRAKRLDTVQENLDHALYGMMSETGEIADCIKKSVIYGKPLDEANLKEELGDLMWYVALAANSMGWQLSSILEANCKKLEARYPLGIYTNADALARADKSSPNDH